MPVIVHADVDAFFVSVERRGRPRFRDRPFVVAHEVVACASYEARALGVRAGMPLAPVLRRWPQLAVAPTDTQRYVEASEQLFAFFHRYTPVLQPGSMEEAFLDMTGRVGPDVEVFGREFRVAARRELGLPLSVGIGRTKLWAKLASRRAKPDGLVVIAPAEEATARPALRLADLWGVGVPTAARLDAAGLVTVADLAGHDEASLRPVVGTGMARRLLAIAAGTDDAHVRAPGPRRAVSAQRTISPPTRARSRVEAGLTAVVDAALARLTGEPRLPRRAEVTVRLDDGAHLLARAPLTLADPEATATAVHRACADALAATGYEADGRGVTLVGVALHLSGRAQPEGQLTLGF